MYHRIPQNATIILIKFDKKIKPCQGFQRFHVHLTVKFPDRCIEKLSNQRSNFKTKLQKKYKGQKDFGFEELPDIELEEEQEELKVVRAKKFQLEPMGEEEAIMQMEMLNHDFFVFLNMETDSVNVVYKRKDGNYGVLETTY